jgi:hypothetical protein
MPILSIARKLGIPGTRRISPECGGRDKHDNGRTSSDRAGDAGGLGRIVGDATHLRGFAARGVFVRCVCRPPLYIAREGIRNVFKDLCKSAPAELAGNK